VPCNTAHAFLPAVQARLDVPVVDIIEETVRSAARVTPSARRIGILATTGTVLAGLYSRELARTDLLCASPGSEDQLVLMAAIAAVKAGSEVEHAREDVARIARRLVDDDGAEALILGCSELPLLLAGIEMSVPTIDSSQCLAEAVVARVWDASGSDDKDASGLDGLER
jgi:aspartate racemase